MILFKTMMQKTSYGSPNCSKVPRPLPRTQTLLGRARTELMFGYTCSKLFAFRRSCSRFMAAGVKVSTMANVRDEHSYSFSRRQPGSRDFDSFEDIQFIPTIVFSRPRRRRT